MKFLFSQITVLFFYLYLTTVGFCEVSLSVDPRYGSTTQVFTLGVRVTEEAPTKAPEIHENDDFSVRYVGPQQSVKIINGSVSQETTFFYRLKAKHDGSLETPPVTVLLPSGPVHPKSLEVAVSEGGSAEDKESDVLIEQMLTPESVYRGQQLIDTVSILTPYELRELRYNSPALSDLWEEPIRPDERDQEVRNNQPYSVIRMRAALFPLKSGTLSLPAKSITAVAVRSQVGSLLDDLDPFNSHFMSNFLSQAPDTISAESNTAALQVKELPPLPDEASLWNASDPIVGSLSIEAKSDPAQIKEGEAKDITVVITTNGNANTLTTLPLKETKRWKVYSEQPKTNSQFKEGQVVYTKTFHATVVPTGGGDISLPSLKLTYFDPKEERYKIAESGPIHISVEGTAAPDREEASPVGTRSGAKKVESPKEEEEVSNSSYRRIAIGAGILLTVLGILSFLKKPSSPQRTNIQAINPTLSKDAVENDTVLYRVFTKAIESKYGVAGSPSSLRSHLREALLDSPIRFQIESLLDEIEERLYGRAREESARSFEEIRDRVYLLIEKW